MNRENKEKIKNDILNKIGQCKRMLEAFQEPLGVLESILNTPSQINIKEAEKLLEIVNAVDLNFINLVLQKQYNPIISYDCSLLSKPEEQPKEERKELQVAQEQVTKIEQSKILIGVEVAEKQPDKQVKQIQSKILSRVVQQQPIKQQVESKCIVNWDYKSNQILKLQKLKEQLTSQVTHFSFNNLKVTFSICELIKDLSLQKLTYLSLQNLKFGVSGLKLIVESRLPLLRYLYCSGNQIADEGTSLLEQTDWKYLTHLSLSNNGLTAEGNIKLGKVFPKLISLNMKLNSIEDEGLKSILLDSYKELQYLHLESCKIGKNCVDPDEDYRSRFPKLTSIYLNNNSIGQEGLKKLLNNQIVSQLTLLNLQNTCLTNESLQLFINPTYRLQKIICLDFSNNLQDQAINKLASAPLTTLEILSLKSNKLTVQSISYLTKMKLPRFKMVQLENNDIREGRETRDAPYRFQQKQREKVFVNV